MRSFPQATGTDNYLYDHENGLDDYSTGSAVAINAFVESSDFDIGDGQQFMLVNRILPSDTVVRTATSPVEQYTDKIDLRARGRQISVRIENTAAGVKWRLGAPRIDVRPDGRR